MSCGRAVCPPGPSSVTSMRSQAAVIGAGAQADLPGGHRRVAVQRERPGGAVEDAGGDHLGGAAGHGLLGRLEDARAPVPGSPSSAASAMATPRTTVVCTSCPQAWQRPSRVEAYGHVLEVGQRQGVDVGPQDDDRVARSRPRTTSPVPVGSRRGFEPDRAQPLLQEGRRLELGEGELRDGRAGAGGWRPAGRGARRPSRRPRSPASRRPGSCRVSPAVGGPGPAGDRRAVGGQPVPHLGEQAVDDRPSGRRRCAAATARCRW